MTSTEIFEEWKTEREAGDTEETWEEYAENNAAEVIRGRGTKLVIFEDGGAYHFDGGNGQWYEEGEVEEVKAWMSDDEE